MKAKLLLACLACASFFNITLSDPLQAEAPTVAANKQHMNEIFQSFSALQQYIGMPGEFTRKENDQKVGRLLKSMADNFHQLNDPDNREFAEQGIQETLKQTGESLNEISKTFSAGKKDYALWRLRNVSTYCVTCHSRLEIKSDFASTAPAQLTQLSLVDQGNYYFATRQFARASDIYLKIAFSSAAAYDRLDAMRRWLVIEIRVHPDPQQALVTLERFSAAGSFPLYEATEIQSWISSIKQWQKEQGAPVSTPQDAIVEARRLVSIAGKSDNWLAGSDSLVEMLRASAILHQQYSILSHSPHFAETLYLLGAIYSRLPRLFQSELPEVYLEQCIREFPGSIESQKAYRILEEIVLEDFTGSSGTHLPDEDRLRLEQLRQMSHHPAAKGKVRSDL